MLLLTKKEVINLPLTLAQRLVKLRKEHDMTQQEVADKIGVGQSLIWRWESGEIKRLRQDKVQKLANLYGVSEAYIATGIDIGNLPEEVEEWIHRPENREKVISFYKKCKLEEAERKLNNIK